MRMTTGCAKTVDAQRSRKPRGFGELRAERVVHAGHDQDFGGRDQFTQAGRATKRASPP
jgi:hypothetical protein